MTGSRTINSRRTEEFIALTRSGTYDDKTFKINAMCECESFVIVRIVLSLSLEITKYKLIYHFFDDSFI